MEEGVLPRPLREATFAHHREIAPPGTTRDALYLSGKKHSMSMLKADPRNAPHAREPMAKSMNVFCRLKCHRSLGYSPTARPAKTVNAL